MLKTRNRFIISNYPNSLLSEGRIYTSINVLSYSEKIAKQIYDFTEWVENSRIAKKEIQLVTSKQEGTYFNPKYINIGTTFKTGVDIKDENPLFIIITPCYFKEMITRGESGIFSDGDPSIIQAMARVRNGGDILVFSQFPEVLISGDYTEAVNSIELFANQKIPVSAEDHQYEDQQGLIQQIYRSKERAIRDEIELYNNEVNNNFSKVPPLRFPSLENFTLEYGQSFLATSQEIFGRRVIPYMLWAAFNDQFQNCRLKGFLTHNFREIQLDLTSGRILHQLNEFFENNGIKEKVFSRYAANPNVAFNFLVDSLRQIEKEPTVFTTVSVTLDNGRVVVTQNSIIKRKILSLMHLWAYNEEVDYNDDTKYSYVLASIEKAKSGRYQFVDENIKTLYIELGQLRDQFIQKLRDLNVEQLGRKLEDVPVEIFADENFISEFTRITAGLQNRDPLMNRKVFSYNRDGSSLTQQKAYELMVKTFLRVETVGRNRYYRITGHRNQFSSKLITPNALNISRVGNSSE